MPDRGLLTSAAVQDVAFGQQDALLLPNAAWLQVTFEVDRESALSLMPQDVGRPIPPYGRLFVGTSPAESFALLSIGGRYRMMPRNVLVEAVVASRPDRFVEAFGAGVRTGSVELRRAGADASAAVDSAEGRIASVSLSNMYAIEPTMLRWDAFVGVARERGAAVIAEITPAHEVSVAFLSKTARVELDPALPRTSPWRRLRSLGVISACYVEGSLNFSAPSVQQTWT